MSIGFGHTVTADVTVSPAQGLTVEGDFRKSDEVRTFLKARGLRWSSGHKRWYLPKSAEQFSPELITKAQQLVNCLQAEFGVPTQLHDGSVHPVIRGRRVTGAVTGLLPAVDLMPALPDGEGCWVGSRYETTSHLPPTALTTMIRGDINVAKRQRLLPAGLSTSVRKHEVSGALEIHVRVLDWRTPWQYIDPANGSPWMDPTVDGILATLKTIVFQYNRLDVGSDYRNKRFHQSIKMGEDCNQQFIFASPTHPTFQSVPYQEHKHSYAALVT